MNRDKEGGGGRRRGRGRAGHGEGCHSEQIGKRGDTRTWILVTRGKEADGRVEAGGQQTGLHCLAEKAAPPRWRWSWWEAVGFWQVLWVEPTGFGSCAEMQV